jgi:hypothetical protein
VKASSIELKLAAIEAPKLTLNRSTGMVEWGKGHSFPARLLELVRSSPTQSSITKTRAALVAGEGFTQSRSEALESFLTAKLFVNGKPSRTRFLAALALDYATFGGYAFQVIPARGGAVAELHYQRFATVASGEMNEDEMVTTYHLCRDWKDKKRYPPTAIPAWSPASRLRHAEAGEASLYYYFNASAEQDYYPLPDFTSVLNYLETEAELARYHVSNVSSRFSVGTILSLPAPREFTDAQGNVVTVETQQRRFNDALKENFSGPNGDRILTLFGDDPEKLARVQPFTDGTPGDLFSTYADLCRTQILAANRVPSPAIVGLGTGASLGGEANTLRAAFSLYYSSVCRPDQLDLLAGLKDVLAHGQGVDQAALDELDITTTLPAETALLVTPQGQVQIDALLASALPRANKLARLTLTYGLSAADAEALVPEDVVNRDTPQSDLPPATA